jgi:hypothetical protein
MKMEAGGSVVPMNTIFPAIVTETAQTSVSCHDRMVGKKVDAEAAADAWPLARDPMTSVIDELSLNDRRKAREILLGHGLL